MRQVSLLLWLLFLFPLGAGAGMLAEHPQHAFTVEIPQGWIAEISKLIDDDSGGAEADLELRAGGARISIRRIGASSDTLKIEPPIPEGYMPVLIGYLSRTWKVRYDAPQRMTFPTGGEAVWAAAPGASTPYVGLVRRDGQTFSIAVSLDSKRGQEASSPPSSAVKSEPPGTREAFFHVLRTVRPMADRLPAKVEPAFRRASEAVARGNWAVAIKELASEPKTFPPVLLTLGVAHANAGLELSALAWLGAYEALMRDSSYFPSARLRLELKRLEMAVEAKVSRILDAADRAAAAMVSSSRTEAVVRIAAARAQAGDIRGLRNDAVANNPASQARVWFGYAFNRMLTGDLQGIRDALEGAATARGGRDAGWQLRADSIWVAAVVTSAYEGNRSQAEAAAREIQGAEKRKEGEDLIRQLCGPAAYGRAFLEDFAEQAAREEAEVEPRLEATAKSSDPNQLLTGMIDAASGLLKSLANIRALAKRSSAAAVTCGRR